MHGNHVPRSTTVSRQSFPNGIHTFAKVLKLKDTITCIKASTALVASSASPINQSRKRAMIPSSSVIIACKPIDCLGLLVNEQSQSARMPCTAHTTLVRRAVQQYMVYILYVARLAASCVLCGHATVVISRLVSKTAIMMTERGGSRVRLESNLSCLLSICVTL